MDPVVRPDVIPVDLVGGLHLSEEPLGLKDAPLVFAGERPEEHFALTTTAHLQHDKNSCLPHGASAAIENGVAKRGNPDLRIQVCIADLYSGCLYLNGNEGQDVGCTFGAAGRWVDEKGVLPEHVRPYRSDDVTRRSPASLDVQRAKGLAARRAALALGAIQDAILAVGGVAIGQPVCKNYVPDAAGLIPVPTVDAAGKVTNLIGLHATELEGWRTVNGRVQLLMRESWLVGIDHPLAATDERFSHLLGKRSFSWRDQAWVTPTFFFEPMWFEGTLNVK